MCRAIRAGRYFVREAVQGAASPAEMPRPCHEHTVVAVLTVALSEVLVVVEEGEVEERRAEDGGAQKEAGHKRVVLWQSASSLCTCIPCPIIATYAVSSSHLALI